MGIKVNKLLIMVKKNFARRAATALLIALALTGAYCTYLVNARTEIANNILRFHVLANSDEQQDQALKLKVRDEVLRYLRDDLDTVDNLEQAQQVILAKMPDIRQVAQDTVYSNGYGYAVAVRLEDYNFPTKYYAGFALPAGQYRALRIEIGNAAGQNWFCVLFPPLCFDGEEQRMPDSGEKQLKKVLSDDKYSIVVNEGNKQTQIKFRILEIFNTDSTHSTDSAK